MTIIPIVALATLVILFLLFLSYQTWWQSGAEGEGGIDNLLPVDLDAFRNLTDPEEAHFLRLNLSPEEFRKIQRIRLRATAMYISVISKNAGRLVVIGRSVSSHPDAEIATAGLDIVHRAVRLKLWCSLSLLKLNATTVWPTFLSPSSRIADRYLDITSLTRSLPTRVAA